MKPKSWQILYMVLISVFLSSSVASNEYYSNSSLTKIEVHELQEGLIRLGYSVKYLDGMIGRQTEVAISKYAKEHGLVDNPEVVLQHIRSQMLRESNEELELESQLEEIENKLKEVEKKVGLNSTQDAKFFTKEEVDAKVSAAASQVELSIYKSIFIPILVAMLTAFAGIFSFFLFLQSKLKNEIENQKNNLITKAITGVKPKVEDMVSQLRDDHNVDFGGIIGRITYFIHGVREVVHKKNSNPSLNPVNDGLIEDIQATFETSCIASMEACIKASDEALFSNSDAMFALTNGLFYLAEDIEKELFVRRSTDEAKRVIKRGIDKVKNHVCNGVEKTESWLQMADNICYSAAVTNEMTIEEIKEFAALISEYVHNHKDNPQAYLQDLFSIYPDTVQKALGYQS